MSSQKITGVVDRVIFHSKDNGYHILNVELPNEEYVTITATHPKIHEGLTYEFHGNWTSHPKHGKQMKSEKISEVSPNTKEGLRAYLSSSFFPGIGVAIANKIIARFKDDVIRIFNEDIDRLGEVSGISPKKLIVIKESWRQNDEINDVMMFLQQFGITTVYAAKIYKHYGNGCVDKIKENPYTLAKDVSGIGFKYADKIALEIGFNPESDFRISACVMHVLESGTLDGHCYLLEKQIINHSSELLGFDTSVKIENILTQMIKEREIMTMYLQDKNKYTRYYSKKIYFNERYCANKIGELLLKSDKKNVDEKLLGNAILSDEQKSAVLGTVSKHISVLIGAPGVGKTYTSNFVIDILLKLNKYIAVCSPTGKAAMKSTQTSGFEAVTIHRLLGFNPETFGFMFHENNKLPFEYLIIEESSMIDINLMASLLKAVGDDCQVLMLGDFNQLSPISAGSPFKDIIESGIVPVFELTQIFRQAKESNIITTCHKIKDGMHPQLDSPLVNPEIWNGGTDCMFIESGVMDANKKSSEYPKSSSLRYGKDIVEMVKILYMETVKKYYNIDDIQILIPLRVSNLGCIRINSIIQDAVNPSKTGDIEIIIGDKKFKKNDQVMNVQNNYDLGGGVFNGESGKIISIEIDSCKVKFDDGKIIEYRKSDMIDLELSYAISCHKSQGSDYQCVIFLVMPEYSRLMTREIVYTAASRAKKLCIILGNNKSFYKAIDTVANIRQTSLKELLKEANLINSITS